MVILPHFVKQSTALTVTTEDETAWLCPVLSLRYYVDWTEVIRSSDRPLGHGLQAGQTSGPYGKVPLSKRPWIFYRLHITHFKDVNVPIISAHLFRQFSDGSVPEDMEHVIQIIITVY